MAAAYSAGAANLPFGMLRGYVGTDLVKYNQRIKFIDCPFTGVKLAAIPAHRPDVTVIHAQKADRKGNVLMWGVVGVQKEAVLAAKRAIVTVEEIVDDLHAPPNSVVLPSWVLSAVCEVKGGAFPSYAQGYYQRDNAFYKAWDPSLGSGRRSKHGSTATCSAPRISASSSAVCCESRGDQSCLITGMTPHTQPMK